MKKSVKRIRNRKTIIKTVSAIFIVALVSIIGYALLTGSHAAIPSTPTVTDVCGSKSASDISLTSALTLPSQSTAVTSVISNSNIDAQGASSNDFKLYDNNGTEEIYVMSDITSSSTQQEQMSIYNLSSGAQIGSSFPVDVYGNSAHIFTIDGSGNVYVVNSVNNGSIVDSAASYNSSGTQLHYITLSNADYNGAYSYTDSAGWHFAFTAQSTITGSEDYNQTGQSYVYNSSFTPQTNNNMIFSGDVQQDPNTGDIEGLYNNDTVHVYSDTFTSGSSVDTYPLKLNMGTNLQNGAPGAFNFNQPYSIVENPSGGYYVSTNGGVLAFDQNGGYLGESPASDAGGSAWIGFRPGTATIYNNYLYFYTPGSGTGPSTSGIYKVSLANLNTYVNSPQGTDNHIGIGAGMYTNEKDNFFPSGTTPQVYMQMYPWWGSEANNFTIKYQVRSVDQIQANDNETEYSIPLSTVMNSSTTGITNIQLDTADGNDNQPGAYEISAKNIQ